MSPTWWVPLLLALVLLGGWYLSWTAARLDRLHHRVESSRAALDAQLVRRASTALELATSGLLDPASALLLAESAQDARDRDGPTGDDDDGARELAESFLTKALHAALDDATVASLRADPVGRTLLADLERACARAALARRFANDAVGSARALRARPLVRGLRLAGHAPLPTTFEMDDTPLGLDVEPGGRIAG